MNDYSGNKSKINTTIKGGAPAGASGAPEAPLVYKRTIQPPPQTELDLTLTDHETGEVVSLTHSGESASSLADKLTLRYKRQTQARKALYGFSETTVYKPNGHEKHHRTCYCNHVPYSKDVDLLRNPDTNRFHLSGLVTCASAATCPVCESIISERRANELRSAFNQAKAMNLHIQLLTFTIPHTIADDIETLRPAISKAQQLFFNGSPWKRCREKYGIVAYARTLECRFGLNGWHPHFHFIVFSRSPLPKTQLLNGSHQSKRFRKLDVSAQSSDWLWWLERWQTVCEKSGISKPNEYGLDIRDGSQAYDYITKYGQDGEALTTNSNSKKTLTWDMADEITKGAKKNGKDSLSPFQLLDVLGDSSATTEMKQNARIQFLKYARSMKGVPLMRWSKSAFDVFCFDDKSDDQLLRDESDVSQLLLKLSIHEWRCILKHASRDQFMEVVNSGCGLAGISAFVQSCVQLDNSDYVLIDTPIDELGLLTSDFTESEQLEMFDSKLSVIASFDHENLGDSAIEYVTDGLFDDDTLRSLVTRKARWDQEMMSNVRKVVGRQRRKELDHLFDQATESQKRLALSIDEAIYKAKHFKFLDD